MSIVIPLKFKQILNSVLNFIPCYNLFQLNYFMPLLNLNQNLDLENLASKGLIIDVY